MFLYSRVGYVIILQRTVSSKFCLIFTSHVRIIYEKNKNKQTKKKKTKEQISLRPWVAFGKFLEEFVYLAVKICHRDTLPSATPSFQVGKNFENRKKHQRRRIAWVGQADFGKLELNNRNHGGKCQRLSAKRDQFETRSI